MGALASIGLAIALAVGPNGGLIARPLTAEAGRGLPVRTLAATAPNLWVVFHELPDVPMALYLPPVRFVGGAGTPDPGLLLLSRAGRFERLLPGLEVPRIFLYAPYYRRGDGLVPLHEMSLDVAEYLLNALFEAYFDRAVAGEPLRRRFAARAVETMRDVPAEHRREAYLGALADFGSHLLSVVLELERLVDRQRAAGKDVCRVVDHPATLFGKWPRLFAVEGFPGRYQRNGRSVLATSFLERPDKEILTHDVLDGSWTGDVRRDFGLDCP